MEKALLLNIIFLIKLIFMFEQDLYDVTYERAESVEWNRGYLEQMKMRNFKYNRTYAVTNISLIIKKNVGTSLILRVQAYKFMSNEYRLFPLRFQFNFCEYAEKNEFGLHRLFECGNWSCPIKTGHYEVCNFALDAKRFPPLVPGGQWKLNLMLTDNSNQAEVIEINLYISISYPLV